MVKNNSLPEEKKMIPDVFLIGAMKAGTTSFYNHYLVHPELSLTKSKEHNGFIRYENKIDIIESYVNSFPKYGKLRVDISPKYSQAHLFPGVAQRIHALNPNAKIIYLLRNPLDRAKSHFYHDMLRDRVRVKKIDAILSSQGNPYVESSRYYYQIKEYLKYFSKEQILIIKLEDLTVKTEAVERQIKDFLGLSYFQLSNSRAYDSDVRYKIYFYDFVHKILGEGRLVKLYHLFFYLLQIKPKKVQINEELRNKLNQSFKIDNAQLYEEFGLAYDL